MAAASDTKITIRFSTGSKANKIEEFPLSETREITIGRSPSSTISFDASRDDVVSRNHAVIRISDGDQPSFTLEDVGSSNGTFINGEPVKEKIELSPDDKIELGKGGPTFTFDVQPRPKSFAARTRVISAVSSTATRVVETAKTTSPGTTKITPPPKVGVGKETVERMMFQERSKTNKTWAGAAAAALAVVLVGGGALYWKNTNDTARLKAEQEEQARKSAEEVAKAREDASKLVNQQIGLKAADIVKKFSESVVYIEVKWQLYDRSTSRPLFIKTVSARNIGLVTAFVRLPSGKIVPWLTDEPEDKTNVPLGGSHSGTGFVVSEQGFILTNKHVAATWLTPTEIPMGSSVAVFDYVAPKDVARWKPNYVVTGAASVLGANRDLARWHPEDDGGIIFNKAVPTAISNNLDERRAFAGRNESIEVRFPGSVVSIAANVLRSSPLADVSLIKIDSPQALTKVDIAPDGTQVKVGEPIIVLGYPGVSENTLAVVTSSEAGNIRNRVERVPEPTVSDGIVARLGSELRKEGNVQIAGDFGDAFQLTATGGSGNSGGPVFNNEGKVIGIYTYSRGGSGNVRYTFGVPIKHGRDLLQPQRTQ